MVERKDTSPAKLVTRWKLAWWTTPDAPGAYQEVKTYSCHNEPGRYAFHQQLPSNSRMTGRNWLR